MAYQAFGTKRHTVDRAQFGSRRHPMRRGGGRSLTGRFRSADGSDYLTLDEFFEAQTARVSQSLRTERFERIMEERNDHMLLAQVLNETEVEVRR